MRKLMRNGKFLALGVAVISTLFFSLMGSSRAQTMASPGILHALSVIASHMGVSFQVSQTNAIPGLLFTADLERSSPLSFSATSSGSVTVNNRDGTKAGTLVANTDSIITYVPAVSTNVP